MPRKKGKIFEGQRDDEHVVDVIRRHWWAIAWVFVKVAVAFIVVVILYKFFGFSKFTFYIFLAWFVLGGTYLAYNWFNWYRDRYILTDQRIINIQQRSLFSRAVYEAPYERIQDINYEINGFWATLLGFGDVNVQTAGSRSGIKIQQISNPRAVKQEIVEIGDVVLKDVKKDSKIFL